MDYIRAPGSVPAITDLTHDPILTVSGLGGGYRVIRLLGRGTISSVYLAEQISMARLVALKILSPALSAEPAFVGRFLREARASARLNHPNIVSAIDFGECDSRFFLAMEYVDGKSLSVLLDESKALEENLVIDIGLRIVAALRHATLHNVIHLDVKPANIMICKDGGVKLTDFGLAIIVDSRGRAEASHKAIGTPYYMAPEQVEGSLLDWRADQFSLGASLYEAVTGEKPFYGDSVRDILVKRFFESPPPAWSVGTKRVSGYFSAMLARMLSRSPGGRYQSFDELEDDFNLVREGRKPNVARNATFETVVPVGESASGYAWTVKKIDGLLWQRRWDGILYFCLLFLAMLSVYFLMNFRVILGPSEPKGVDLTFVKLAREAGVTKGRHFRDGWTGALRLSMRAEKEPTRANIRRAIHSLRLLTNNREFDNAVYGKAARESVAELEKLSFQLNGENSKKD